MTFIDAATTLHDDRTTHFLVIGEGARRAWLEAEIQRRGLTNITVLDRVPNEQLSEHLAACDVSVIPYLRGMEGVSVPSRMYNVMASGRPIVAVAGGDSEPARTIVEEEIGWVVDPGDAAALVNAVLNAKHDAQLRAAMGERARNAAVGKYSRRAAVERYVELMSAGSSTAQ